MWIFGGGTLQDGAYMEVQGAVGLEYSEQGREKEVSSQR